MKRFATLLLSCLLALPGYALAAGLTVAVAANVKYAFDDLAAQFKTASGIEVESVVSSSGKLAAQIKNGAPFDIFLSADTEFPQALYKDGYTSTPPRVYAYGALVLWTLKDLDLGKGMQLLADDGVRKIALANPKVAPYGREALKALEHYGLRSRVEPKLVFGESIAQVSQYVDTQSADIGFTAKSIVLAPETAGRGKWMEVPKESYEPIAQAVVVLKHASANPDAAQKFIAFLFSPSARAIFQKYGYTLP